MICCVNCFVDSEIKGIIESLNNKGKCDICNSNNVFIYNTNINNNLVDSFNELLSIYTPKTSLPSDFPIEKLSLLKDELYNNWNIFSKSIENENIYHIIVEICSEKYQESPELFYEPIGILDANDTQYLEKESILKNNKWEDFVTEIKTKNRFHTHYINTDALKKLLRYIERPFKKGSKFYRARISNKNEFSSKDMYAPPPEKATAGRVNPLGINYLYLATNQITSIHEIRAGAYDYLTIGEFELIEDIRIVDFTLIEKISPFYPTIDAQLLAINKKHLQKISNEMAKPVRKSDGPLDYLPTQYIADFIKSIEDNDNQAYHGIKYKSTLYKKGENIALFNQKVCKCADVTHYDIESIDYKTDPILT
ncbi:RES family NAD+ phosphorylase [Gracilibacillus sp. S3-1-1]|uniref:RES family NAD+ phosphorylase n=1 Tax=Gracilibacillus pellucidus TaxID=3095368 RepID=A0ACC6M6M5_9BACI|nr:RES family NAD+ phosphorylase [Gracilibacillus sp. S3-1-1]MDX8046635.1 RES family NAD+ phosphorylase [Gracilibacillus sp. S3-1-1]